MNGIIIAGGFGTRLRPLTFHRPKHLLPVANRPFLEYQVALLKECGIRDLVFASNYLWEQIQAHFGDGSSFGVSMRYALESEPLGTAGAIRNASALTETDLVIVLNGDVLTDFDLRELIRFHEVRDAEATIALRSIPRPHAFGVLETESDGRVREWREPTEEEKKRIAFGTEEPDGVSDTINAGIYILERDFINRIPADVKVSIERETYPRALADGCRVFATTLSGFWLDIGNPSQYLEANGAVVTGQVKTGVDWRAIHPTASLAPGARVSPESVVGPNSIIGQDTVVESSVILDGVRIGAGCVIRRAVLDSDVELGDGVDVAPGAVLSADAAQAAYPPSPPPSAIAR